jgi:thymidylate kinase
MRFEVDKINSNQALDIVRDLCSELAKYEINYCHWKSNVAINRSASGENDLDLLVSRSNEQNFTEILLRLGYKQALVCSEHRIPGILDYYGHDQKTGHLVHVHVHYQLVLGHDATKNYHIPIEEPYLASSTQLGLFKIPSAEFELIVLVIRLMLKHASWDTLLLLQGKLSFAEKNELDYLMKRISQTTMNGILNQHLPNINPNLFEACLLNLTSSSSVLERSRLGQKLINSLTPYARRPQIIDSILKLWRRVSWPINTKIFRKVDGKQIINGGLLIAVVGGDGAGKTTIVNEIYNWFSSDFKVHRFHMGKPNWSLLTYLVRGVIKIGRSFGFYPFMKAEIVYTNDINLLVFPGYPWLIREICTARDRYLTYKKARRLATNGDLVILDRFPLPQIKFMDGPQVERMTINETKNRFIKYLIYKEESYYKKMKLPDMIVLLLTDPEIAARRKTDEKEEEVRARSTEIWEIDWNQTPVCVINANLTKMEVLSKVKKLIWSRL